MTMSFLAFAIAAVVLAITPGPGIAYVVARTVAGGRSEGLASCFGTGIGGMLHVLAAALGLSLVLAQSAVAFNLVKYLGVAYLIYLGIRLLLRKDQALPAPRALGCLPGYQASRCSGWAPTWRWHGVRPEVREREIVQALNPIASSSSCRRA